MRHFNVTLLNRLFFSMAIAALATVAISCNDDDDNCSKLQQQGVKASIEALEAISNEDCEGIEAAFATSISVIKKGKSCSWVKDLMEDYEVETIAELEAEFIMQREQYLDDAGCGIPQ